MTTYKCLIVDDERLARELIENHIQQIPYLEIVASCANAIEAMQILNEQTIDLLFLDIQMPNLSGLDFLRMLKNQPATILTTAYSEYALEGFELEVIDYLVKPIEFERFFKAVNKAIKWIQKTPAIPSYPPSNTIPANTSETYFFVKSDAKMIRIEFANILYIEALQKYSRIYTQNDKIITLSSLSKLLESLPKRPFIRVHRSFIVNIDQIDHVEGNMIKIQTHTIPISKGQRDAFVERIRSQQ